MTPTRRVTATLAWRGILLAIAHTIIGVFPGRAVLSKRTDPLEFWPVYLLLLLFESVTGSLGHESQLLGLVEIVRGAY